MATNGRSELYRTILAVTVSGAFGAWAWVVNSTGDQVLQGQERIERRLDEFERRLDRLERDVASHEQTLDGLPPRWLIDRLERLERTTGED